MFVGSVGTPDGARLAPAVVSAVMGVGSTAIVNGDGTTAPLVVWTRLVLVDVAHARRR